MILSLILPYPSQKGNIKISLKANEKFQFIVLRTINCHNEIGLAAGEIATR